MTLNEFSQDVATYLCNKLPDVNVATLLEIAEYTTAKAHNYAQDEVKVVSEQWYKETKKIERDYRNYMKRMWKDA
jgi:hypothetical protein